MEKMWRKFSTGQTSSSAGLAASKKKVPYTETGTTSSAGGFGFGEPANVAAVPARRRPTPDESSVQDMIGIEKRRRRRRKSRPKRNGQSSERNPLPVTPEATLKQRAVAKLKLFNFTLNWDLQMTQCKPCGPRTSSGGGAAGGSGGGNLLTRRLCRTRRRRDDNELYRSNSFKFERFERKEGVAEGAGTLSKQISICDDYSLPVDFVNKKRPSSFDPCLAESIPNNWTSTAVTAAAAGASVAATATSPLSDHVKFIDHQHPELPLAEPLAAVPRNFFPSRTRVKLIEGYSDPKDTRASRSARTATNSTANKLHRHHSQSTGTAAAAAATGPGQVSKGDFRNYSNLTAPVPKTRNKSRSGGGAKRNNRRKVSDSDSGPKSSAEEDEDTVQAGRQYPKGRRQRGTSTVDPKQPQTIQQLNSPDSLSEDFVFSNPLGPSPRRSQTLGSVPESSKKKPSPYYYSDLLQKREEEEERPEEPNNNNTNNDSNNNAQESDRQRKTLLTTKYQEERFETRIEEEEQLFEELAIYARPNKKRNNSTGHYQNLPGALTDPEIVRLRHSQKEGDESVRVRTPSLKGKSASSSSSSSESESTTSDDSNCSECQKRRREWHAQALALVQQSCNVVSRVQTGTEPAGGELNSDPGNGLEMAPHRLLGPVMCACAAPSTVGDDDVDEMFRPRSIFYVHKLGEQGCEDCRPTTATTTTGASQATLNSVGREKSVENIPRIQRRIYETSFDTKIYRSDDDLDNFDNSTRVALTPHSMGSSLGDVLGAQSGGGRSRSSHAAPSQKKHTKRERRSNATKTPDSIQSTTTGAISASALSQDLEHMHIHDNLINNNNNPHHNNQLTSNNDNTSTKDAPGQTAAHGENNNVYTPSTPPSTAPLPMKFPGKSLETRYQMNSIKSAPNLPQAQPKLLKSIQSRELKNHHGGGKERPRSVVLESGRVLELKRSHQKGNFSSTESMATSSSGGSMESIRSSTSEGNRSTSSSESRHSSSLSSHSSDSHSSSVAVPGQQNTLRAHLMLHSKLHILSPISDKSSQEPASEGGDLCRKRTPEENVTVRPVKDDDPVEGSSKIKRRLPQNKNLLLVAGGREEIQGSDSGISLHSRDGSGRSAFQSLGLTKFNPTTERIENSLVPKGSQDADSIVLPQDLKDLPFDMPKLRRRRVGHQPEACTSGSATSVDLGDLPFDMPKLRRRLRQNESSNGVAEQQQIQAANVMVPVVPGLSTAESSECSQASSSHSVREEASMNLKTGMFRQNLTLNLFESHNNKGGQKFGGSLDFKAAGNRGMNLNLGGFKTSSVAIDATIPLDRQNWYHGSISRIEAENTLRPLHEGSFLVRNSESTRQDYSLSLKSAKGFMHMRIQRNDETGEFILGQFSRPFTSIPDMIRHFCLNRLPVRGAEHMVLLDPVDAQIL